MGDLQCDIRPGNACLGLLWLADDLRKRLEWCKGPEIASKWEFVFALFLDFSSLCS